MRFGSFAKFSSDTLLAFTVPPRIVSIHSSQSGFRLVEDDGLIGPGGSTCNAMIVHLGYRSAISRLGVSGDYAARGWRLDVLKWPGGHQRFWPFGED